VDNQSLIGVHPRLSAARHGFQHNEEEPMKDPEENCEIEQEYDFRKGERGKFHRPGAVLRLPVYLDQKIQDRLMAIAARKGIALDQLVGDLLSKQLEIAETLGP
jgi:hypothetical protein